MDGLQLGQLGDHPLSIPQGGGVAHRHHNGPVCAADGQTEPRPQAGGGVDEHIVVGFPGLLEQGLKARLSREVPWQGQRGGEKVQTGNRGVGHRRPGQVTPAGHHVAEIHQRRVGHAQGDVQVAQAHVTVQAQHLLPQQR